MLQENINMNKLIHVQIRFVYSLRALTSSRPTVNRSFVETIFESIWELNKQDLAFTEINECLVYVSGNGLWKLEDEWNDSASTLVAQFSESDKLLLVTRVGLKVL